MIQKNSIAAIVVLYNPETNDLENIKKTSLIFDHLYVINNSPENVLINEFFGKNSFQNLTLFNNTSNLGIANAMNKGCELALNSQYQWVVTLDQDSFFTSELLSKLIVEFNSAYNNNSQVGIITPIINNNGTIIEYNPDLIIEEIDYCITSGNMVNLEAWQAVNGYNEKLFIYHVDNDFCLRLKNKNYSVIRINSAMMEHQIGKRGQVILFGKSIIWDQHNSIANYYITRNTLYFVADLIKSKQFKQAWLMIKYHLIKENLKALFFQKDRIEQLKFILMGYFDGLRGKYGKL
jgi:rhamnosyltransferase